ncbi:hypothetical protein QE152_g1082 [Popillia japonica]|uniref:Uncharacterized protein n=1 Tax=Popillia japonica TaxID=7064 RepID=A0AAW1NAA8_POPJA
MPINTTRHTQQLPPSSLPVTLSNVPRSAATASPQDDDDSLDTDGFREDQYLLETPTPSEDADDAATQYLEGYQRDRLYGNLETQDVTQYDDIRDYYKHQIKLLSGDRKRLASTEDLDSEYLAPTPDRLTGIVKVGPDEYKVIESDPARPGELKLTKISPEEKGVKDSKRPEDWERKEARKVQRLQGGAGKDKASAESTEQRTSVTFKDQSGDIVVEKVTDLRTVEKDFGETEKYKTESIKITGMVEKGDEGKRIKFVKEESDLRACIPNKRYLSFGQTRTSVEQKSSTQFTTRGTSPLDKPEQPYNPKVPSATLAENSHLVPTLELVIGRKEVHTKEASATAESRLTLYGTKDVEISIHSQSHISVITTRKDTSGTETSEKVDVGVTTRAGTGDTIISDGHRKEDYIIQPGNITEVTLKKREETVNFSGKKEVYRYDSTEKADKNLDSPIEDSLSHHASDTGISITRGTTDTLSSMKMMPGATLGLQTTGFASDIANDVEQEEGELTDAGLSPIQADELPPIMDTETHFTEMGTSPIEFPESSSLPLSHVDTSEAATLTDQIDTKDASSSPIRIEEVPMTVSETSKIELEDVLDKRRGSGDVKAKIKFIEEQTKITSHIEHLRRKREIVDSEDELSSLKEEEVLRGSTETLAQLDDTFEQLEISEKVSKDMDSDADDRAMSESLKSKDRVHLTPKHVGPKIAELQKIFNKSSELEDSDDDSISKKMSKAPKFGIDVKPPVTVEAKTKISEPVVEIITDLPVSEPEIEVEYKTVKEAKQMFESLISKSVDTQLLRQAKTPPLLERITEPYVEAIPPKEHKKRDITQKPITDAEVHRRLSAVEDQIEIESQITEKEKTIERLAKSLDKPALPPSGVCVEPICRKVIVPEVGPSIDIIKSQKFGDIATETKLDLENAIDYDKDKIEMELLELNGDIEDETSTDSSIIKEVLLSNTKLVSVIDETSTDSSIIKEVLLSNTKLVSVIALPAELKDTITETILKDIKQAEEKENQIESLSEKELTDITDISRDRTIEDLTEEIVVKSTPKEVKQRPTEFKIEDFKHEIISSSDVRKVISEVLEASRQIKADIKEIKPDLTPTPEGQLITMLPAASVEELKDTPLTREHFEPSSKKDKEPLAVDSNKLKEHDVKEEKLPQTTLKRDEKIIKTFVPTFQVNEIDKRIVKPIELAKKPSPSKSKKGKLKEDQQTKEDAIIETSGKVESAVDTSTHTPEDKLETFAEIRGKFEKLQRAELHTSKPSEKKSDDSRKKMKEKFEQQRAVFETISKPDTYRKDREPLPEKLIKRKEEHIHSSQHPSEHRTLKQTIKLTDAKQTKSHKAKIETAELQKQSPSKVLEATDLTETIEKLQKEDGKRLIEKTVTTRTVTKTLTTTMVEPSELAETAAVRGKPAVLVKEVVTFEKPEKISLPASPKEIAEAKLPGAESPAKKELKPETSEKAEVEAAKLQKLSPTKVVDVTDVTETIEKVQKDDEKRLIETVTTRTTVTETLTTTVAEPSELAEIAPVKPVTPIDKETTEPVKVPKPIPSPKSPADLDEHKRVAVAPAKETKKQQNQLKFPNRTTVTETLTTTVAEPSELAEIAPVKPVTPIDKETTEPVKVPKPIPSPKSPADLDEHKRVAVREDRNTERTRQRGRNDRKTGTYFPACIAQRNRRSETTRTTTVPEPSELAEIAPVKPVTPIDKETTEPVKVPKPIPSPKSPADLDEHKRVPVAPAPADLDEHKRVAVAPAKEVSREPSPVEEKPAEKEPKASPIVSPETIEEPKAESPEPTIAEKLPAKAETPEKTEAPKELVKEVVTVEKPEHISLPASPKEIAEAKLPEAEPKASPIVSPETIEEPKAESPEPTIAEKLPAKAETPEKTEAPKELVKEVVTVEKPEHISLPASPKEIAEAKLPGAESPAKEEVKPETPEKAEVEAAKLQKLSPTKVVDVTDVTETIEKVQKDDEKRLIETVTTRTTVTETLTTTVPEPSELAEIAPVKPVTPIDKETSEPVEVPKPIPSPKSPADLDEHKRVPVAPAKEEPKAESPEPTIAEKLPAKAETPERTETPKELVKEVVTVEKPEHISLPASPKEIAEAKLPGAESPAKEEVKPETPEKAEVEAAKRAQKLSPTKVVDVTDKPSPKSPADLDEHKRVPVAPAKEVSREPSPVEEKPAEKEPKASPIVSADLDEHKRVPVAPAKEVSREPSPVEEKPAEKEPKASPIVSPETIEEPKAESPEPTVAEKLPAKAETPERTETPKELKRNYQVRVVTVEKPEHISLPASPKEIAEAKLPGAESPAKEEVKPETPEKAEVEAAKLQKLSPTKVVDVTDVTETIEKVQKDDEKRLIETVTTRTTVTETLTTTVPEPSELAEIAPVKPVTPIDKETTEPVEVPKPIPSPKSPADLDEDKLVPVALAKEVSREPSPVEEKPAEKEPTGTYFPACIAQRNRRSETTRCGIACQRGIPKPIPSPKSPADLDEHKRVPVAPAKEVSREPSPVEEKPAEKEPKASPIVSPETIEEPKAESPEPTVAEKLPAKAETPERTETPKELVKEVVTIEKPEHISLPASPKEIAEAKLPGAEKKKPKAESPEPTVAEKLPAKAETPERTETPKELVKEVVTIEKPEHISLPASPKEIAEAKLPGAESPAKEEVKPETPEKAEVEAAKLQKLSPTKVVDVTDSRSCLLLKSSTSQIKKLPAKAETPEKTETPKELVKEVVTIEKPEHISLPASPKEIAEAKLPGAESPAKEEVKPETPEKAEVEAAKLQKLSPTKVVDVTDVTETIEKVQKDDEKRLIETVTTRTTVTETLTTTVPEPSELAEIAPVKPVTPIDKETTEPVKVPKPIPSPKSPADLDEHKRVAVAPAKEVSREPSPVEEKPAEKEPKASPIVSPETIEEPKAEIAEKLPTKAETPEKTEAPKEHVKEVATIEKPEHISLPVSPKEIAEAKVPGAESPAKEEFKTEIIEKAEVEAAKLQKLSPTKVVDVTDVTETIEKVQKDDEKRLIETVTTRTTVTETLTTTVPEPSELAEIAPVKPVTPIDKETTEPVKVPKPIPSPKSPADLDEHKRVPVAPAKEVSREPSPVEEKPAVKEPRASPIVSQETIEEPKAESPEPSIAEKIAAYVETPEKTEAAKFVDGTDVTRTNENAQIAAYVETPEKTEAAKFVDGTDVTRTNENAQREDEGQEVYLVDKDLESFVVIERGHLEDVSPE